jgi:hypothetical protein
VDSLVNKFPSLQMTRTLHSGTLSTLEQTKVPGNSLLLTLFRVRVNAVVVTVEQTSEVTEVTMNIQ